jgi:hypothetical protein
MEPPEHLLDHPVRWVSYEDLENFAEWAGMHVPTEAEWEWAMTGPEEPPFPWGWEFPGDAGMANWGARVKDGDGRTASLPVDALPEGASWCGARNGIGNVTEWTSSWFESYPGGTDESPFFGEYVKVIRGGSAADADALVLRPAVRNFLGSGISPPYPENSFEWAGVRLAAYPTPGQDALGPVVRRAVRPGKLRKEDLDLGRFRGASARHWVKAGELAAHHVIATERARSIVWIPCVSLLREEGSEAMRRVYREPTDFGRIAGLARETATERPEFLLGVLHVGVSLKDVQVLPKRAFAGPVHAAAGRSLEFPPTRAGTCGPGTYLLAVWFGRLALLTPGLELVGFLDGGRWRSTVEMRRLTWSDAPWGELQVDPLLDSADLRFAIPVGGRGAPAAREGDWVRVELKLEFPLGLLELLGSWEPPPFR